MFSFKIKNLLISFSFSFFAIIALLILIDGTNYAMLGLIACLIHELGHIFIMCLLNISPSRIIFYGSGIKIIYNYNNITTFKQDFFILIAGSMTNFIVFFSLYSFSNGNYRFALFATINLVIGIFNLIPFKHFDGGKIIDLFINSYCINNSLPIRRIIRFISILMLVGLGVLFFITQKGNISLYFSIGYIIFSELML